MSNSATLTSTLGDQATVYIPETLAEVPLSRYIDFIVESRAFGDTTKNQVAAMARACGAFYGVDLETMINRTLTEVEGAEIQGLDNSLRTLLGRAYHLVSTAGGQLVSPDKAEVNYLGEIYRIPVILQKALTGEPMLPGVTVIEAVEAAEVQRLTQSTIEAKGNPGGAVRTKVVAVLKEQYGEGMPPLEVMQKAEAIIADETTNAGDPDGSLMFGMYLRLLAIFLRKDGETLPINDSEREEWIDRRAEHFQHIDAQTALNIDFFLQSISQHSENAPRVVGFLIRPIVELLAAAQMRLPKPAPKPNRKMRRSLAASGGGKLSSPSLKKAGMANSKKSTAQILKMR